MIDNTPRKYTGRRTIRPDGRPMTHAEIQRRYMKKLMMQRDQMVRIQKKIERMKTLTR